MPVMSINVTNKKILNKSPIEVVHWPVSNVLAMQTTRVNPFFNPTYEQPTAYQSFNLGLHVGDDIRAVESNRKQLQSLFSQEKKIQWLEQVHGNEVLEITQASDIAIVADAAITRSKNVVLAIMTADCLPVLLSNKSGSVIAAIHGGWRPLSANIVKKTVEKMSTQSCELYAWLGPCISAHAFEVGEDVRQSFVGQHQHFLSAFRKQPNNKYLANLPLIAILQLKQLGIKHINHLPECTFSKTKKYYSYRRQQTTGRMATLISIT